MENIEQIDRLHQQIYRMKKAHTEEFGLAQRGDGTILRIIGKYNKYFRKNPTSVKLSQVMGITQPTITPMINRLVKNGLVERTVSPTDRRAKLLSLTPEGEAILAENNRKETARLHALIDHLGEEDTAHAIRILERLADYLEEATE